MRLDKFLCKSTDLSRAEAVLRIHQGEVMVNAEYLTDESVQVHENNHISLQGERLTPRPSRYILVNKPAGCVCSNVDEVYPSVFNYLGLERVCDLHVAGRLDADTTGLVLITDDGRWSFNIIRPDQKCEKTYRVTLRDAITDDTAQQWIARLVEGIQLQGERALTQPATLAKVAECEVLLTITEGKYHQVKRMFAALGNKVVGLHRERIGCIELDVEAGQWRALSADEVDYFL